MSDWHQRPAADWPTNGGQSTGHLSDDLILHILRNQTEHARVLSEFKTEFRGQMADTRSRLSKLEKARSGRKMAHQFALKDLIGFVKAAAPWIMPLFMIIRATAPWIMPLFMIIRATLGQIPWANVIEVLSKLGESGAVH